VDSIWQFSSMKNLIHNLGELIMVEEPESRQYVSCFGSPFCAIQNRLVSAIWDSLCMYYMVRYLINKRAPEKTHAAICANAVSMSRCLAPFVATPGYWGGWYVTRTVVKLSAGASESVLSKPTWPSLNTWAAPFDSVPFTGSMCATDRYITQQTC